jgi:hypothetical protein
MAQNNQAVKKKKKSMTVSEKQNIRKPFANRQAKQTDKQTKQNKCSKILSGGSPVTLSSSRVTI